MPMRAPRPQTPAWAVIATLASAGLMTAAPAAADPPPPAEPSGPVEAGPPPPPPQTIMGAELQVDPITALSGLLAASPQPPVLGTGPLPPETVSSGPAADPMALTQLLLPQNFRMPTDDQDSPYPLAPNSVPSPFARIDAWKGVHALIHGGFGRMPGAELGQPLPGTAAPAGINLPPGLEQFYVDPNTSPPPLPPPTAPPPA